MLQHLGGYLLDHLVEHQQVHQTFHYRVMGLWGGWSVFTL